MNEENLKNMFYGLIATLLVWLFNKSIGQKIDELSTCIKELSKSMNDLAIESKASAIVAQKTNEDVMILRGHQHKHANDLHLVMNDFERYKARVESLKEQVEKCQRCKD